MVERSHQVVHADFFSDSHRITCRVHVGNTGLIGMMNDTQTSVVEVEDVYVSRLPDPARIVANFEYGSLAKAGLSLCVLGRREDVGPLPLLRGGFTKLTTYPVLITTSAFELRGQLEMAGKMDVPGLLVGGTGRFFALYAAAATTVHYADNTYTGGAILVNRNLVAYVGALPRSKA